MKTIISLLLLLAVVKLIHCQDNEQMIVLTLQGILQNLESINSQLKDMKEKLQHVENNLQDVHQELGNQKTNFQDMQEKLQHLENNLQGLSRETARCLKGEDLEHLTNVSAAANQEIKSFHEEMSEVIAWSQKDKCSEGSLLCGQLGSCKNNPFSFTCSCPSGFTWDGSECKDVDECVEGKNDCVPNATCNNSIGSYSCSCNKPFKGDGRTSCEFHCRSPAKRVPGVGCIMVIEQHLPFTDMKDKCEEEGGRLTQHMGLQQVQDIGRSLGYLGSWVGVYDGKWMSDRSLVPEDLWSEIYRSDPSKLCGRIGSVKFYLQIGSMGLFS
ncbi:uncharacterized protein [Palaemon carinicauda]|uniref:uncharacterized protein isoform X3 n=1 Tax=Palaemon carinicauda TaxID=392227 RepID=UPI0035B6645F